MRNRQAAHALGMQAEHACAEYLRGKGYTVLAERVRTGAGEIDLVAVKDDLLVVVEVKARAAQADALESVTPAKCRRLARAAEALLADPSCIPGLDLASIPPNIRFDVMAVMPGQALFHLEDAWRPDEAVL